MVLWCVEGIFVIMAYERKWEEFPVGPGTSVNGQGLRVTIDRKGGLMIGAKAFEKMGKPEAAVLLFDRRNHTIGLAPAGADASNAYPMIAKRNCRHRVVRANQFCRHHGIYVPRTAAFGKAEIDEEGVLVLDLRSLIGVGGKPIEPPVQSAFKKV